VLYNAAQNSSGNLPSYPPDNHHSSDIVIYSEGVHPWDRVPFLYSLSPQQTASSTSMALSERRKNRAQIYRTHSSWPGSSGSRLEFDRRWWCLSSEWDNSATPRRSAHCSRRLCSWRRVYRFLGSLAQCLMRPTELRRIRYCRCTMSTSNRILSQYRVHR